MRFNEHLTNRRHIAMAQYASTSTECKDEIEALRAIYGDDALAELEGAVDAAVAPVPLEPASHSYRYVLTLQARPASDGVDAQGTTCSGAVDLAFTQPPGYPLSRPVSFALRWVHGGGVRGEAALHALEARLRGEAEAAVVSSGAVVVYDLSVATLEWLGAWVEEHGVAHEPDEPEAAGVVVTRPTMAGVEAVGVGLAVALGGMDAEAVEEAASLSKEFGAVTLNEERGTEALSEKEEKGEGEGGGEDEAVGLAAEAEADRNEDEDEDEGEAWTYVDSGDGGDDSGGRTTDSESDWSDAELREADSSGTGAPPSAAQGAGRPWWGPYPYAFLPPSTSNLKP
jgi:hypothetical protein